MEEKLKLKEMIARKEGIEDEIKQLNEVLISQGNVGMSESLVDSEGYPRNDIDLYQVRTCRNKISCLQNDHKALMKEIEEELHLLHAKTRSDSDSTQMIEVSLIDAEAPFAAVDFVSPNSPAESAGLIAGDQIVQFGSVNRRNFQNLQSIAAVVQHSEGKNIEIKVLRNQQQTRMMLTPRRWSGRGLLGCNIVPV